MKIAVASDGVTISEHFGHCAVFLIYHIESGAIRKVETVEPPAHKPGVIPNFLSDLGVQAVIAGGMGQGALSIFDEKGIEVITGAQGMAESAVSLYLAGKLSSSGSVCSKHEHARECGEHA